jgi:guanylate kinase
MNNAGCEIDRLFINLSIPLLIVVSGPSGVGKDAILNRMKHRGYPYEFIVTSTTRPRRANEKNGIDYNFISAEKFQDLLKENGLLEWAQVYGNWYGVPKKPVRQALSERKDIIIKVDVQGAATIKKILPEALFIFIAPPSFEELAARLTQRRTESDTDLALRLKTAEEELKQICNFDYVVLNRGNGVGRTIDQIRAIISAEKCRVVPRRVSLL